MKQNTKMCKIKYSTKGNQIKIQKVDLDNSILKYDVIHDTLKVICDKHLKCPRNFGDMGSFGDISTRSMFAKIVKLRRFFGDNVKFGVMGISPLYCIL